MKEYWLFVGQKPMLGGMWEFWDKFDFLDEAIDAAKEMTWPDDKYVFDIGMMSVVWSDPPSIAEGINQHLEERGF